ncbi:hypothetical protein LINPERHAP1_LOCUS25808, partial [Linum perenne]
MIGKLEASDGLYVLRTGCMDSKELVSGDRRSLANVVSSSHSEDSEVLLWHFRLGHPSF